MKTEAIIFDLDGTLLNTIEDIAAATNHALKKNGYPEHPPESYQKMVGHGLKNLIEQALPKGSDENHIKPVFDDLIAYYMKHPVVKTYAYDGIFKLIEQIELMGIPMSILSNKMHEITVQIVSIIFKNQKFVSVYGSRDSVPKKPDPTSALGICGEMKTLPENTLFIGDSGTDIKTAKNAGMPIVAVTWGFRPKESLIEAGAVNFADKPEDLLRFIQ